MGQEPLVTWSHFTGREELVFVAVTGLRCCNKNEAQVCGTADVVFICNS